jgi:predicted DNA-binding protein (MmcQ/YjbR family)
VATFDDVRAIAMTLPEAEEIVTWETDITFRVRKKIFAIGGEGSGSVSIKATPATQADLIEQAPATFHPSAYVGRFGWVTADLGRIDDRLLRTLTADTKPGAARADDDSATASGNSSGRWDPSS